MMPNPATALETTTPTVHQRTVSDGYVSTVKPAPAAFTDPLWVTIPEYDTDVPFGPCEWGAIHGIALPEQGARVVVAFDEHEVPVVVWWEGPFIGPGEVVDTGWLTPTLKAPWKEVAGGEDAPASYRRIGSVVRLRGVFETGSSGTSVFTLPSGFQPPFIESLLGSIFPSNFDTIQITPAGNVYVYYEGSPELISICGVSFTVN